MAQHDFVIDNQGFPAFRSDLNNVLSAIASNSSGSTEPTTTFAYQWWYDTSTNILKMRNADDDAWITIGTFNQTTDTFTPSDVVASTGDTMTGALNFGDNVKAQFGAGSDLQIYHDGSNSYIDESTGQGSLVVKATDLWLRDGLNQNYIACRNSSGGDVALYYNNSQKLATTSTGVSVTGKAVGTLTTDNDLSFDMNASNQFKCTPTANGTLTFTNITAGQSGNIFLVNSGGYAISAAATTYISAADLSAISTAGSYFLSYFSDGTNVMVSASAAVTSAGA